MNKHEQPLLISHAPTVKRYFTGLCCDENIWCIKKRKQNKEI